MSDQVREQELPGIGRRYSVQAEGGELREVTPPAVVSPSDDQGRRLGAVLARGGFSRILPSPAVAAGPDGRLGPFTAGDVLVLAIAGPLAASRAHILAGRMPARLFPAPAVSRKDSS